MPVSGSGRVADYLGVGLAADRPVAATIAAQTVTNVLAFYFATDTDTLSMLDPTGPTWVTASIPSGSLGSMAFQNANAVAITGGSIAGITDLAIADGGTGASSASAARSNLGLVIGTDVQAYDVDLQAIAALATTAYGRNLLTQADAAAVRAYIGAGTSSTTGTVTSVDVSGGTTGFAFSGGPITTSGSITLSGTLNVANGGTGATTLTGYVKGNGTSAMTASTTIPVADVSGLGTAAVQNIGTSGATVPLLNAANTWGNPQIFEITGTTPIVLSRSGGTTNISHEYRLTTGSIWVGNANGTAFAVGPSNNLNATPNQWLKVEATLLTVPGAITLATTLTAATVNTTTITATAGSISVNTLGLTGTGTRILTVNTDTDGSFALQRFQQAGLNKWEFGKTNDSQTGSNAGSDFWVRSFTDAGVTLAVTMRITRATSAVVFVGNVDAASYSIGGTAVIDVDRVIRNRTYTVSGAPSASVKGAGAQFYCTNPSTGQQRPYWSNGTNWYDATGTLLA